MLSEPGFQGRIGRTYHDSEPWWPELPAGLGGPNVVMIVLDDTGFAHFGCYGSDARDAEHRSRSPPAACATRASTPPRCAPRRAPCLLTGPQPPRGRHARRLATGTPASRTCAAASPRARRPSPSCCAPTATPPTRPASGTWRRWRSARRPGRTHNWPLQKGFDRFYGFLQGETDQFYPELTQRQPPHRPARPPRGRLPRVSEDIVDQSTGWIRDLQSVRPDRPFFLYLAFGAMHAPHQAPLDYLDEVARAVRRGLRRAARALVRSGSSRLGVVPAGTTLAPRNPGVPAWDDLTANQQRVRLPAAGGVRGDARAHRRADRPAGRLPRAARPARRHAADGALRQRRQPRGRPVRRDGRVQLLQRRCGRTSTTSSSTGSTTSAGRTRTATTRGVGRRPATRRCAGTSRTPTAAACATRSSSTGRTASRDAGAIRRQFCHAVDIAADDPRHHRCAGAATVRNGVRADPDARAHRCARRSPTRGAPPPRAVQYFEQMGHRGIWADGWKATTYHEPGTPYRRRRVGAVPPRRRLLRVPRPRRPSSPEKLRELIDAWWAQAGRDGRAAARRPHDRAVRRLAAARARRTPRTRLRVPARRSRTSPPTRARRSAAATWTLTAEVDGRRAARRPRACSTPAAATTSATRSSSRTARCTSTTTRSARTTARRAPVVARRRARTRSRPASTATARPARSTLAVDGDRPRQSSRSRSSCACSARPGSTSAATRCRPVVDDYDGAVPVHRHDRPRDVRDPQPPRRAPTSQAHGHEPNSPGSDHDVQPSSRSIRCSAG